MMKKLRQCLMLLLLLCGAVLLTPRADAADATTKPLRLGIAPFQSAPALMRSHRPLREFLTRTLKQEVNIYTAHNHEQFLIAMLEGRYDMVITPVHFLSLVVDKGYEPLVRYRNPLEVLLIVRKNSPFNTIESLRGNSVGLPDRMSLYHIVGMQWLNSISPTPEKDFKLSEQPSHMAGMVAVEAGRLDATITTRPPWMMLNVAVRDKLRPISSGHPELPSLFTLAHKNLGDVEVGRIRAALEAFPQNEEGKTFFEATGYGGYVKSSGADVAGSRSYEALVTRLLNAQN